MSIEENIIEWEEAQYYNYKLAYTANDIQTCYWSTILRNMCYFLVVRMSMQG